MEKFEKKDRDALYQEALHMYGFNAQAVVAVEELSEIQKEICKTVRGIGNQKKMAEEIADARIMLEQMELFCDLENMVSEEMCRKLTRLRRRLHGEVE